MPLALTAVLFVLALVPDADTKWLARLAGTEQADGAASREPPPVEPTVDGLRRYARSRARARKFAAAIGGYERLLALAPGDPDALLHLAQLYAWSGNYDKAIVVYRDLIVRQPDDLGLKSDLADVLTWGKRLEEAERLYEEVLARDREHHEALKGLARARLLRGEVDAAKGVIDRALALYPEDVDLYRERASMLSQKGQPDHAIEVLQQALRLGPSDADVLRQLAETFQQQRDWPRAIDTWLRVAQLAPDAAGSHVGLGRAYLEQGRLSLAREHAELALRMSPTDAAATQLSAELDREARVGPLRSASEWAQLLAYAALLPVMLLLARKSRRSLRRSPGAWAFANYVVPGFIVLGIAAHLLKGVPWRWGDARLVEAASEVVIFLGLCVSFIAVLRKEPIVPEFAGQVVLALGAHPDDIELGCAGFLLKLKASGARVYGLTLTKGEIGAARQGLREKEAQRAAAFLGLNGYEVLDFPDTGLSEVIPELKAAIEAKIKELKATMVLMHTDVDVHGDHRAVFAATREAARAVPTVLCYEDVSTTNQFTPDLYVDISGYIEDHLRACAFHRTQDHRTYMDAHVLQGRAAHRGLQIGVHFALAFRTVRIVR
jgi:LmbE family N-acetylglucosaminyl deacetylase/tetratricopeptide (TPR) repeat protein